MGIISDRIVCLIPTGFRSISAYFLSKIRKKSFSVFYLLLFSRWKLIRILPGALKRRPLLVIKVWWITVTLRLRDSDSIFWFDGRPNAVQEQSRAKKWQETV